MSGWTASPRTPPGPAFDGTTKLAWVTHRPGVWLDHVSRRILEGLAGFPRRCDVDHRLFVNGNPIVGMDRVSLGVPAERSLPDDRVAEERIATSGEPLVDDAVDRGSGEPACGVVAP
jgi:hypothetical protein